MKQTAMIFSGACAVWVCTWVQECCHWWPGERVLSNYRGNLLQSHDEDQAAAGDLVRKHHWCFP